MCSITMYIFVGNSLLISVLKDEPGSLPGYE